MEFLILGSLEIRNEQGTVALGGVKPRAVMAVLLLHANEPVSAERLALALWGEDAPGGAVKTVQVHVSRLRKALGDAGAVTTTAAGYCLRVLPDELDAERFERLLDDGRRALGGGQPEQAATSLRAALALWRGPALADLAGEPFAQAEIARLEEQRLTALETCVEAELAAGRHAAVVGELQQLVVANPTRERLAGQLMLALYRGGRQSEALEAYQSARGVLVAEVGVEPGPELRRLQEAILRQDVSLEAQPVPVELPRELDAASGPALVGRDAELRWLQLRWGRARAGAGGLVTVVGERGAGKRRLAAELAGEAHRRGDTVLYASGRGPADAALVALRRARDIRSPALLVMDEADGSGAAVLAELSQLTRGLGKASVLVLACAQDGDALAGLHADGVLTLGPLDAGSVGAIAGDYAPGRAAADVPADWLLEASAGIPGRVHEVAGQWARREAARHVGAVAGRAESGRAELRTIAAELTGGLVELQEAQDRAAPQRGRSGPVVCPFKGLSSYDVADAQYFFGREQLIAELVARLVGAPLLAVVGPSGSGKSSVLRAGLLPALSSGVLPGSEDWAQVLIRPGEQPLQELRAALSGIGEAEHAVLAVDQFEEAFTVCGDERERAQFISELVSAATDRDGRRVVVLALRADYYGRCAAYPELSELITANNVLVGAMSRDELRRAIERPAQRAGLRVEPELADALVADVDGEPGALPLLSSALLELWQRRDGRRLRHASYEQTGGVRGAVARLAEDAFGQLDESQRAIARGVLIRLTGEGAAGGTERRRVPLAELEIERDEDVARVVALLTDRRLLTVSAGTVELAHEALLREWPRLRAWIDEDREGLRIQRAIGSAAREWQRLDRDDGALYRGTRLSEAIEWRDARPPALNELEREFLAAGEASRERERVTRRRRVGLTITAAGTALLAVCVIAVVALFASRERDVTASRELARQSRAFLAADPARAVSRALEAHKRHDTSQAETALRQATHADRETALFPAHKGNAYDLSLSADGRRAATAGEDGLVRIWDVARGRLLATIKGHAGAARAVSLSPDADRVASVGEDGDVAITDLGTKAREIVLRLGKDDPGLAVDYSADGTRLIIGTTAGKVGVLTIRRRPAELVTLGAPHEERVFSVRFNRDGTRAISASDDGTARLWDVANGGFTTLRHPSAVYGASFSPDGARIATVAVDGKLRIWPVRDPAGDPQVITVDDGPLYMLQFSRDGRRLVTAGADGLARVSDVGGGPLLGELRGHRNAVNDAGFAGDGSTVVSVGEDGTLRTWAPLVSASLPSGPDDHTPYYPSFSADGKRIVSGYYDGDVREWDPKTGADTGLPRHSGAAGAFYSPDGAYVLSASSDGDVRLWDVKGKRSRKVPTASDAAKLAAAIDTDGDRIAIAADDGLAVIQAPDGSASIRLPRHGLVNALSFSRDDKHLVSASTDGTARIWDAASGRQERVLRGHGGVVLHADYSADGRRVATAGADGTVRVWPVDGGPETVLYGHEGAVNTVEFDHAGGRLVSAGADGTVRVWDAGGGEPLVLAQVRQGSASGASFSPDGRSLVSAGEDGLLVSACEACGSFAKVLQIAGKRRR